MDVASSTATSSGGDTRRGRSRMRRNRRRDDDHDARARGADGASRAGRRRRRCHMRRSSRTSTAPQVGCLTPHGRSALAGSAQSRRQATATQPQQRRRRRRDGTCSRRGRACWQATETHPQPQPPQSPQARRSIRKRRRRIRSDGNLTCRQPRCACRNRHGRRRRRACMRQVFAIDVVWGGEACVASDGRRYFPERVGGGVRRVPFGSV